MTQHQIARFCFKLLGLFAVITGVGALPTLGMAVQQAFVFGFAGTWNWVRLVPMVFGLAPLIQIGLGVWIWRNAGIVAAWATGSDLQDAEDEIVIDRSPRSIRTIQVVVFSCFGVWVLIHAIPDAVSYAALVFWSPNWADAADRARLQGQLFGQLASVALRLLIGFWLVFGATKLAEILPRGLEDPKEDDEGTSDP